MADLTLSVTEQTDLIRRNRVEENGIVLANVIELAANVISGMAGTDIADTINKQTLNRSVLANLIAGRIKEQLLNTKD